METDVYPMTRNSFDGFPGGTCLGSLVAPDPLLWVPSWHLTPRLWVPWWHPSIDRPLPWRRRTRDGRTWGCAARERVRLRAGPGGLPSGTGVIAGAGPKNGADVNSRDIRSVRLLLPAAKHVTSWNRPFPYAHLIFNDMLLCLTYLEIITYYNG